ncbi:22543_t:CDS:2 [Rhizophagus irregularis]|nr:22543_t:CDS:2 [Rhizophagus irregularis]
MLSTMEDYISEVQPCEKILPDNLRNELKKFFKSVDISPPQFYSLSPRVPILQSVPDSVVVNNKHLALLSSWIDSMDNDENASFIFSLGDGKNLKDIILSRVEYGGIPVYNSSNSLLGFQDLNWFEGRYKNNYFQKEIMKGRSSVCKFTVEEYEVFQVIKNETDHESRFNFMENMKVIWEIKEE